MRRCLRRVPPGLLAVVLSGLWWVSDATAQRPDHPEMLPTRDVVVTYRVDGVGMEGAHKMQVTYARSGLQTRIDYFRWVEAKDAFVSIVFDRPANRSLVIMPEEKGYTLTPIGATPNRAALLKPWMQFARKYESSVAGTACTQWEIRRSGNPDYVGNACVTDDGVVLHLVSNDRTDAALTAITLSYGPTPTGIFNPPMQFTRLSK